MSADVSASRVSYEEQKALARSDDPAVRIALAQRADVRPEILYFLAEDTDPTVRRSVAENRKAPRQTFEILARDDDEKVRGGLAQKIADLAPGLTSEEQDKLRRMTYDAMETLARDQLTRVRAILSQALHHVVDAPREVIRILAEDTEIEVSGPVLENSPVLTDADLLEIIEAGPAKGGLNAISRRHNVSEQVADAIVGTDDVDAIADLLGNDSAQIREETLDDLIERADSIELWQAPLVGRPTLPQGAAERLARFVADNLLEVLQARADLDPKQLDAVKREVANRLAGGNGDDDVKARPAGGDFLRIEPPLEQVRQQHEAGMLTDQVIGRALQAGDQSFVFGSLIVLGDVETDVARRIFMEKSAKGILALCWRAGLPVKTAVQIEQRMGRLAPSDMIRVEGDDYPLSGDQLAWQIEFFRNLTRKGGGLDG